MGWYGGHRRARLIPTHPQPLPSPGRGAERGVGKKKGRKAFAPGLFFSVRKGGDGKAAAVTSDRIGLADRLSDPMRVLGQRGWPRPHSD